MSLRRVPNARNTRLMLPPLAVRLFFAMLVLCQVGGKSTLLTFSCLALTVVKAVFSDCDRDGECGSTSPPDSHREKHSHHDRNLVDVLIRRMIRVQ